MSEKKYTIKQITEAIQFLDSSKVKSITFQEELTADEFMSKYGKTPEEVILGPESTMDFVRRAIDVIKPPGLIIPPEEVLDDSFDTLIKFRRRQLKLNPNPILNNQSNQYGPTQYKPSVPIENMFRYAEAIHERELKKQSTQPNRREVTDMFRKALIETLHRYGSAKG